MKVRFKIEAGNATSYLKKIVRNTKGYMTQAIADSSEKLTMFVKTHYLAPISDTGELIKSTHPIVVKSEGDILEGGVAIGDSAKAREYVNTIVKKVPGATVILPVTAQWLTIPIHALAKNRKARSFRNAVFRGNTLGLLSGSSGKNKKGGTYTPLYALSKGVTVYSRVHTDEIAEAFSPMAKQTIENAVTRLIWSE